MNRTLVGLLVLAAACAEDPRVQDYRDALDFGGVTGQAMPAPNAPASKSGVKQQGLQGETAELATFSANVANGVNGLTVGVLKIVGTIAQFKPTSFDGTTAVWGPANDDQHKSVWKMTVVRDGSANFHWQIEVRAQSETPDKMRLLISGAHENTIDRDGRLVRGYGAGSFHVNWNGALDMPGNDGTEGEGEFVYARRSADEDAAVHVQLRGVHFDDKTKHFDADYAFTASDARGGVMTVDVRQLVPEGVSGDTLKLTASWLQSHAGRADVSLTQDGQPKIAEQCWDEAFRAVFLRNQLDPSGDYGEASACAIGDVRVAR